VSAHQKDEAFRQFSLNAHPLRLLLTVCGPLAIYQAFQQIFTILDTIMAAHVSADAVSAIAVLAQIFASSREQFDQSFCDMIMEMPAVNILNNRR
jgi:Na+-driven multidrug efflux pump